jgi:hemolysin III
VWGLAVLGTVLKSVRGVGHTAISTWLYIAMGWLVLIAANTVWTLIPKWGLFWLLAGGICYTAGAIFFLAERIRFFHFVWHLFVIAGTACHFVAVLRYSAGI